MAIHDSTLPADPRNTLSRRQALSGAAAVGGALALPAGAALAATEGPDIYARFAKACRDNPGPIRRFARMPADGDGLAAIEAGYRRWQAIMAEADELYVRREALDDRAEADYLADEAILAEQRTLWDAGSELRAEILAIPTTSPRGVLIKLALAVEAQTLDGIETACEQCDFNAEDLLPAIVADVRAMVTGRAAA